MGVVYEAYDPQIDRTLALKVLRPDYCATEPFVRRFLREAQAIGRLSHPQIVTVYDSGKDRGTLFIAMELLEGRPLNELILERRFHTREILDLGIQMGQTLQYAHSRGVVHRDIKPSNILVQHDGSIKITDFGIAHIENSSCNLQTHEGEILGTPAYMSPEQVQGKPVDGRSDLFSLGVILYQLSTGRRPFGERGTTLAALFHAIAHEEPPEPVELNSEVPPKLSRVITRCLCKEPSGRYPTGAALAEALRECRSGESAGWLHAKLDAMERRAAALRFPQVFLLVAVSLAAVLMYLFPRPAENVGASQGRKEDVQMAGLSEQTHPPGAAIVVDGTPKGISPLEVQLPPGSHRVTAEPDGHALWTRELAMEQGAGHPVAIQLEALWKQRSAQVFKAPPGAIIASTGAAAAMPPVSEDRTGGAAAQTPPESREEEHHGSSLIRKPIRPAEDEHEQLPEIQGILEIESTPPGAEVLVDGVSSGSTPFVSRIPPGDHELVLKAGDQCVWQKRLSIEPGKEYPFKVALAPAESILAVDSEPPGARILIDGVQKGKTPSNLKLPPGTYEVKIKLRRYKDHRAQVEIARAGQEHSLKAALTPAPQPTRRVSSHRPPPPDPVITLVREARYQLSPRILWRRVRGLF